MIRLIQTSPQAYESSKRISDGSGGCVERPEEWVKVLGECWDLVVLTKMIKSAAIFCMKFRVVRRCRDWDSAAPHLPDQLRNLNMVGEIDSF